MNDITIAPSILSANFGEVSLEIERVTEAGASWIHLDVMDGSFVPSITFGAIAIKSFVKPANAIFDTHLMIVNPEKHIEDFVKAGVDMITVHAEATAHLHYAIQMIKSFGIKAGVSLNPATSLDVLDWVYSDLDMVLLMSVNPGWGGQKFIPAVNKKIEKLNQNLQDRGLSIPIQVDGGVNKDTVRKVVAAGASILVAGNAVFGGGDTAVAYRKNIQDLLEEAQLGLIDRKQFV